MSGILQFFRAATSNILSEAFLVVIKIKYMTFGQEGKNVDQERQERMKMANRLVRVVAAATAVGAVGCAGYSRTFPRFETRCNFIETSCTKQLSTSTRTFGRQGVQALEEKIKFMSSDEGIGEPCPVDEAKLEATVIRREVSWRQPLTFLFPSEHGLSVKLDWTTEDLQTARRKWDWGSSPDEVVYYPETEEELKKRVVARKKLEEMTHLPLAQIKLHCGGPPPQFPQYNSPWGLVVPTPRAQKNKPGDVVY